MVVSLVEAKRNAQEDLDVQVIDEFRKTSVINDSLIFDDAVNPAGGGATLTYGYRRLVTQATADTRAYNTEYTDQEVETQHHSTTLTPLGGSFSVDRVLAKVGPAASGAIALNLSQKIKATNAKFADLVINGDTAVKQTDFDGLDKALTGSDTEFRPGEVTDLTDFDTDQRAPFKFLDALDEFLSLLDGAPTIVVGNKTVLARVRAAARRSGMFVKNPVEDLLVPSGSGSRPIERETYGGVLLGDAGEKAGSSNWVIPVEARTVAGQAETGLTDLYAYRVGLDGFHGVSTAGGQLISAWLPQFTSAGAVKRGEVEMGPVSVALKATKAAAVWRNLKVR